MFSTSRLIVWVILPTLCLSVVASKVRTSDEKLSYESAQTAVADLIQSVGPAYECSFSIVSLRTTPPKAQLLGNFIVVLESSGLRCAEAHKVLAYRGESKGLVFFFEKPNRDRSTYPKQEGQHQNLDLIHEIDPPDDT